MLGTNSDQLGNLLLGGIAVASLVVSIRVLLDSGSTPLLFVSIAVIFPLIVSITLVTYAVTIRHHRHRTELLSTVSITALLMGILFVFTAGSIIWGQQTLGIVMKDQLILVTEMGLGGVLFGLVIGHYYGLAVVHRRRLRRQTEQLRRQNKRLDEFASIVSHDLRNPVNVIAGRLELATNEVENDHLEMAMQACDRMGEMIEDLLALARAEDAVGELSAVDLDTCVHRCWDHVSTMDASLVVETDGAILADEGRLQQLLENLIRNAVGHGGEDVTVRIGDLDQGFYFEDDGSGIPVEYHGDVFTSGFSTNDEGTGLGLAIVAETARAHDWDVGLSESADGGARFEFTGVDVPVVD